MSQISEIDGNYSVYRQDSRHHYYCRWTIQEDSLLEKAVNKFGPTKWVLISKYVPGRTAVQCSARWSGALNPNIHKGRWSKTEDQALIDAVKHFQRRINSRSSVPWNNIAQHIPHRTGIQCQARWTEALDPTVRKGRWHVEEDLQLQEAVKQCGCCWIRVANMIPTRTQRQCRTRWNQMQSRRSKKSNELTIRNTPDASLEIDTVPNRRDSAFDPSEVMMSEPYPIPTNLFTLDDIFAQHNIPFGSSTLNSRVGSISSNPPTPVDQEIDQLQKIMALQNPYFTNVNADFMLQTELGSILDCFTPQK